MKNSEFDDLKIRASICPSAESWPQDDYSVSLASDTPTIKGERHWSGLKSAVEVARQAASKADEQFAAIDDDKSLSPKGKVNRKREVGVAALSALEKDASLSQGRAAVDQQLTRWNKELGVAPKPPTNIAEVAQLAEIRAHIAGIKQNRVGFVMEHANDPRVVAAVLGGPPFLSGLTDTEFEVAKAQIAKRVAPEVVAAKEKTLRAMAEIERGWRTAATRIRQRGGLDRLLEETAPTGISAAPASIEQKSGKPSEKKPPAQRAMPTWS